MQTVIPSPYTAESIILAMQTLQLDPNFAALSAIVKANDIASLEMDLIDGMNHLTGEKLTVQQTEEWRYKRLVFTEFLSMPKTIIESMNAEIKVKSKQGSQDEDDPYHTTESIKDAQ